MRDVMSVVKGKLRYLIENKKQTTTAVIMTVLTLLLIVGIVFIGTHARTTQSQRKIQPKASQHQLMNYRTSQQLTDMSVKLSTLQSSIGDVSKAVSNHGDDPVLIKKMTALDVQGSQLQRDLTVVLKNQQAIQKSIASLSQVIDSEVDSHKSSQTVSVKSLPFKVVSIDMIEQIPTMTAYYHQAYTPLQQGMSLVGWNIKDIDYKQQKAILVNNKKQQATIQLKRKVLSCQ